MSENYKQQIKEMLAERLGIETEEIHPESYFEEDLNLGELELMELVTDIEDEFEIDLNDEKDHLETVADLYNAVADKVE